MANVLVEPLWLESVVSTVIVTGAWNGALGLGLMVRLPRNKALTVFVVDVPMTVGGASHAEKWKRIGLATD